MAHVLVSPLVPMIFYVIDLEGGLDPQVAFKKEISIENVRSIPFLALWRGMSHPGVRWAGAVPFELGSFVSVLSRSFVRSKDLSGKAFVLISREYLNFHSRLAYHFAVVDSFCSERSAASNYVAFRFQGGGAGLEGRLRRINILQRILQHLGFRVNIKGDRLTAVLRGTSKEETENALDQIGRLMAYVRQMDMAATDEKVVERYAKAFLEEDYSIVER
jgi:pyruvate,water dikinase